MRIGETFRYSRPYSPKPKTIDGMLNYFYVTFTKNVKLPLLEAGINPIREVNAADGKRRPAILISSSPHRIGTETTPWQDFFDPDNGHIRFYGDNRMPRENPATCKGNKILLDAFMKHSAMEQEIRRYSVPIIFFRRVKERGRLKGYVQFQGFGIIERVSLITQYDQKKEWSFPNYVFDFVVFDLAREQEDFSWEWISKRLNIDIKLEETLKYGPNSWKDWILKGSSSLEKNRRRVAKLLITPSNFQLPEKGSREYKILNKIYNFYEGKKKGRFEFLAAKVAERIFIRSGGNYLFGWITKKGSDSGIDFVGRFDLGSGFSKTKIIVLGQAKCERFNSPTNALHIARTVARLKRGWVGVYVTTSYFSKDAQREMIEDEYPILLVPGLKLVQEVIELTAEAGFKDVIEYLDLIDQDYEDKLQSRNPKEILFD